MTPQFCKMKQPCPEPATPAELRSPPQNPKTRPIPDGAIAKRLRRRIAFLTNEPRLSAVKRLSPQSTEFDICH